MAEKEQIFDEQEIARLYSAKCQDINLKMYPVQFMRFKELVNEHCVNRKCNMKELYLGKISA